LDFDESIYFYERSNSVALGRTDGITNSLEDRDIFKEIKSIISIIIVNSSSYIMPSLLRNLLRSLSENSDLQEKKIRWRNPVNGLRVCFNQNYLKKVSGSDRL
jgi:hypothetical protein